MNLVQRALLTPAEVLRINRPYLFGYRAPIVEYNQSKIYENTEIKNNI